MISRIRVAIVLNSVLSVSLLCGASQSKPNTDTNPLKPELMLPILNHLAGSDRFDHLMNPYLPFDDIKSLDYYALNDWALFAGKTITFKDIIGGVPSEIEDLKQFIEDSEYFKNAGAIMPRGYIFYGPPGTGKTLLARALAGEVNAAFRAESGASFAGKYIGDGVAKIQEIFEWARREIRFGGAKHAIIFIDELDSIGRRSSDDSAAGQEMNRIINEFLIQMDGFNPDENIIVIGATNRTDLIDEALKRPGRFEYHMRDCPSRSC